MALRLSVVWLLAAFAVAADHGFVGSQVCAGCHTSIAARQAASAHAGALRPAGKHPAASVLAELGNVLRPSGFAYRFYRVEDALRVRVIGAGEATDMQIHWAFGAGGQGVTFVSRLGRGRFLEHGLSYFASGRLGRTPGHADTPASLAEGVGLVYDIEGPEGIRSCFECHSTGPLRFPSDDRAEVTEAGVGCESCHGPGSGHVRDPSRVRLSAPSGRDQLRQCGACHRRPRGAGRVDWNAPWNVRHAPLYLARSACSRQGGLSCTTCHDPHGRLEKTDGRRYQAVCRQCHPAAHAVAEGFDDCVACHMPRVRPHEHLQFMNHWIGIYADGEALRPVHR